jgi:hypothetical protein
MSTSNISHRHDELKIKPIDRKSIASVYDIYCDLLVCLFTVLHEHPTEVFFLLYGDVTIAIEGLQNLGLCSALSAFEQDGTFIAPHLL